MRHDVIETRRLLRHADYDARGTPRHTRQDVRERAATRPLPLPMRRAIIIAEAVDTTQYAT